MVAPVTVRADRSRVWFALLVLALSGRPTGISSRRTVQPPPGCRTGSSAPTPCSCCSHLVDGQQWDPTVVNCPVVNHPVDYSPRGACETLLPIRETGDSWMITQRRWPRAEMTCYTIRQILSETSIVRKYRRRGNPICAGAVASVLYTGRERKSL